MHGAEAAGTAPGDRAASVVAIDDDPMVLLMTARTLEGAGMVCRTATTGAAGLQLIREGKPDLVLLDLVLVGEDGFSICREIRRAWSAQQLPVVMVTGLEDLESINAAYLAGANDFLTKPLHWKHLPHRIRHILAANRAFNALHDSTRTLRSIFAVHPDSIFTVDPEERVTLVHSGIHGDDTVLRPPLGTLAQLLPEDLTEQVRECCRQALGAPAEVSSLDFAHPFQGEPRFWEARFIASSEDQVLVMVRDITQRKSFEQQIHHLAYHDMLTGLWNRHAFSSSLERVLGEVQRSEGTPYPLQAAVLYLDLDNFKRVNDTLGHALGDALLKVVAARISEVLRPSDMLARAETGDTDSVARIGGDEFCVILKSLASPVNAGRVAQRILEVLRQPVLLEGHELVVTPSIGIALIPQDGVNPDTLLKNADRAMYAAKESGRNRFQFFDPSMSSRLLECFALEAGMRRGLARGAFHVFFQPQIDARSHTVMGMEALLRWDDPEMGSISPTRFIPVAEETGLIVELGEFVFREALTFTQSLLAEGLPAIRVAVNLSSVQMLDPQLMQRIENCMLLTGANPHNLEVEVTESVLLESSGPALATLRRMKELGITLALDDFGTGFSSLSYLHQYPFDIIKIDKSFIQSLAGEVQSRSLAAAIIAMGKSLGLEVIAEGVEYLEQANFLLDRGCHQAQGFLYGRPMSPEGFRAYYWEQVGGKPN
ncbi:MAG: EAL domain-containing protein [Holophaga sp.]|nr:EAL domain-containing protein [Holophaga sp.]